MNTESIQLLSMNNEHQDSDNSDEEDDLVGGRLDFLFMCIWYPS